MTLVQVLANETSVHVACDFRLTNPYTKKVVQSDAHKLVSVNLLSVSALIGVTGVAILDGKPIGQWIAQTVPGLGSNASIEDVLESLRQAETPLSRITDPQVRRHTFVVAAMVGSQSLVALVSNFEVFDKGQIKRAAAADIALTVSRIKPKGERVFVTGVAESVTVEDRARLTLSLRAGLPDAKIQEQLSEVNVAASRRADGMVSAGCHVASLHTTGAGSSRPFLTDEQQGDFIPPESAEMFKRLGIRLNPAIGPDGRPVPIRMRQSAFGRTGASPEYFREQLKLQPDSVELWNNYGAYLASKRHFDKAIEAYQKAIALDPSYATAIANLAKQVWLHKGNAAEADRLYADAVAATEPSVPAWILSDYAILCDEGLSDPQRAAELHKRAAQDEDFPLALARQALFMFKHDNSARANSLLVQALSRQPGNPAILRLAGQADWFYNRDPEAARAKLEKACLTDPNDAYALRLTADVSLVLGDAASAAYYYRKAMKRGASGAEVLGNYGLALLLDRKPNGALRQLSRAARSDPRHLGIRTNLAATLWVLGRRSEAIEHMRAVLELAPPPQIELEVLAMLRLAEPSANDIVERVRTLVESGVRADAIAVRSMVRNRPRDERDEGYRLADVIEGKLPIPSSL